MDEKLADLKDKVTEISLTGGAYRLLFDFNAMCLLEEVELDIDTEKMPQRIDEEGKPAPAFSFRMLRAKLWAGLQHFHPEIDSLQRAGDLIPLEEFGRISAEVGAAFLANLPIGKKAEGPAEQTGPSFSISPADSSERTSSGDQPPAS